MQDVELYQQLLGLVAPWTVARVELSVERERVDIWAEHAPQVRWPCPECGTLLPVYDHVEERLAIDVLQEATVRGATRILRISWDEAWHLMQRALKRGLRAKDKRVPARLGVDEKVISKWARYITLVCDLDAATVEYVAEARRMESLDGYFLTRSSSILTTS